MRDVLTLRPIAHIENGYTEKFGIPRQSGRVDDVLSRVVFEEDYRNPDALRGMEDFSHLWLIWDFTESHRDTFSPTVRPPRLGGNTRMGVFATRSPFRPNPLGLSCVRLVRVTDTPRGRVLEVAGADLLNGTPIYDVKPYLPATDAHPDARGGFADAFNAYRLAVDFPPDLLARVKESDRDAVLSLLAEDPRPSYQNDPTRVYGMRYAEWEIRFTVDDDGVHVTDVCL